MKKIAGFQLLVFMFPFVAFPQWTRQNPLPQGNSLASVFFIDAARGFAVGDNGASIMTSDWGSTWADSPNTTSRALTSVCFTDANTGIAVGFGTIQKTVNGGAGWEPVPCNSGWNLYSVCFPNANTGYAVGVSGMNTIIIKTTDGGSTWNDIYWNGFALYSVCFTDVNTGYAVGRTFESGAGIFIKTTDGGLSWNSSMIVQPYLYSIFFPSADTGYFTGENGAVYKTTDAGSNWTALSTGTTATLVSAFFTDVNTGYVTGDYGTILKTTNGGGVSIDEITPVKPGFIIYPNPATTKVTVSNSRELKGDCWISVFDLSGQPLMECRSVSRKPFELDISRLSPGIYFLKIQTAIGVEVKKLVIR
ncbi:MAG: YCF48-related protein [Bacteroidota bacterium]